MPGQPPWVLSLCIPTTLLANNNSFYFYLFIYFDTDDHASVQCSCLGLLFVPISYRIGTHQSKRVDRVCGGHLSRSGRPPGLAREAFCRERMEGCRRGACVLRDPPSPERLRAPRVGGTEFQPPAGLPQLTSPRNSHSEGTGVRFQGPLRSSRAPGPTSSHRAPAALQSHCHGHRSLRLQPVAPGRCNARRSPTSACPGCEWQGW